MAEGGWEAAGEGGMMRSTFVCAYFATALAMLPGAVRAQGGSGTKAVPGCSIHFSILTVDELRNVDHGFTKSELKWYNDKLRKKFPDICYAPPGAPSEVTFFLTATPAVYHGARVETDTTTNDEPVQATVTAQDGTTSDVSGTVQSTSQSSAVVPYSVAYSIVDLAIELPVGPSSPPKVIRRFRQRGLYKQYFGFGFGKGKHPLRTVVQEAITWLHEPPAKR